MDRHDGVVLVVLAAEQEVQFELLDAAKDTLGLGRDLVAEVVVCFSQVDEFTQVGGLLVELRPGFNLVTERAEAAHHALCACAVVPELGVRGASFQFFNLALLGRQVKDAPRSGRGAQASQ